LLLALFLSQVLIIVPVSAKPSSPILLERYGKWQIDYDTDSCKLAGAFGEGSNQIVMQMIRFRPSDGFDLKLYGRPLRSDEAFSKVELAFGPTDALIKSETTNGMAGDLPLRRVGLWRLDNNTVRDESAAELPAISPEQETAVQYLDFRPAGGKFYRLNLRSMGGTMAAMRKCMDNLVASWGYNVDQQATLQMPALPKTPPKNWLISSDYPQNLLFQGAMGIVHYRLEVDEAGGVTACHVQMATKPAGFEGKTCDLLKKRAKFSPALDAKGTPTKSFYVNTVRWIIKN
jgi:hypothetical protein